MKILHVTECYAGGVSRAINSIVRNSDDEHHLLYAGEDTPIDPFSSAASLPHSLFSRILSFRRTLKELRPDIVHAHSSWAGLYTRLLPTKTPIVYEPHCFVFDDPQRPTWLKGAYKTMEALLSFNSKVTVALTAHEAELAARLRPGSTVLRLSNIPTISASDIASNGLPASPPEDAHRFTISMVGRIAPQKDPDFFAQVASLASARGLDWKFLWIGGADNDEHEISLAQKEIQVTGWVDKPTLVSALSNSDVYLHSASYEGFPLSVLDAASLDLPILVRDIPCFRGFDLRSIASPEEALETITAIEESKEYSAYLQQLSRALIEDMSVAKHQTELETIYREALL